MYLKRLEMHGFKSFAEPVVIEFHEGVTCIVGPNGSGKSNISDAIRWVLGEQSPKALRGGKMEEVIFAGTANRKSRGMAEVTLVIDNSTGILAIDYNEVAITRRMYRSGDSEYLINNNQCRLRDIRELIMDTGIGVDGYSLIGQGKIADIVSNKPESRREIFEEAAGVVMYKSKKAEAERKLASTGNNLERVDDIIGEIEGRIDGLRDDSAKAKEYLELKERYRDLEINITLKNIDKIAQGNSAYTADIERLAGEVSAIYESKKKVDAEIAKSRERSENLEELGNNARDKLLQTVEEINRLTSQNQLNQERLSGIGKDRERLTAELDILSEKLEKEEKNKTELEKSRSEILRKHEETRSTLANTIENHSKLSREASELSDLVEKGRSSLFELHSKISGKESEARSYESITETLAKRKVQLHADAESAEKNTTGSGAQLAKAKAEEQEAQERLNHLNEQLNAFTAEKKELDAKRKQWNVTAEELKLTGSQKVSRKKTIEEMESNYEGYNFAVKFIMRTGISGIHGVASDLMSVPAGFEVAVETALGGQLQNIVCDTDATAKKAVAALKENRAGRLTFLPISSIKASGVSVDAKIKNDPGYKGLASDIIGFDGKYTDIFRYLLGRVAIVEDMDAAIRMSKVGGGGLRFVTLDGEIINISGAITGGRYKNKTANLLERKSEIAKLDKEIEDLRRRLAEANAGAQTAVQRLEEVNRQSAVLEKEKHDLELNLAALLSSISALEDTISTQLTGSEKMEREIRSIDREMSEAQAQTEKLTAEAAEAKSRIEILNNEIESAMTAFEEKNEEVRSASEAITKARIAEGEWEGKKRNIDTLLARISETAEDYRFQTEDKNRQLSAINHEEEQILFGATGSEDNIEKLLSTKAETEGYIESVTNERKLLNEETEKVAAQQKAAEEKLNAYQDQKYQLEIKLAKNETQLDTLKERLWEDFEISYAQALDFRREDFVMSTSVKESREIRGRIRELGEVNVGAIKEYETVSERYKFLTEQRRDITTAMDELMKIISDMDNTIKHRFKENFDLIVDNFEKIFKELFGGGHAELRMEDENNPLESGIEIVAQPPGKKLQNINLMSGGEKTMTAIALMFAVLKTKPTPFCILDEVEAALDDANIDRFANYLRNFHGIQFALVTHQKATMEHADVLYGVTMAEHGISKVLSLRLGDDFEL